MAPTTARYAPAEWDQHGDCGRQRRGRDRPRSQRSACVDHDAQNAGTRSHISPLSSGAVKALLQFTAIPVRDDNGELYDELTQGAGGINAGGAIALAARIDGSIAPPNYWLTGPSTGAFGSTVIARQSYTWRQSILWDDNIVWGSGLVTHNQSVWNDNIVWGSDDNIVWGSTSGDDNIVWGSADDDNIVWGSVAEWADNIVWGSGLIGLNLGDNIVWGSDDNIVWGSLDDDNIVWGSRRRQHRVGK